MSTETNTASTKADPKLLKALTSRLRDSLLPGDDPFARGAIEDAARFLLATADCREAGAPAIALQSELGERRVLRIALNNDDMPFLVDSVAATIAAHGLSIERLVHPVLRVERDKDRKITGFVAKNSPAPAESLIYLETERVDAKQRRALEKALRFTLADVYAAVADWPKAQELMARDAESIAPHDAEGASLLRWLNGGMLTQLGHVTRTRSGELQEVTGICRKSARQILADASFDRAFAWFDDAKPSERRLPLIVKANRASNVHRHVPLDLFIVPLTKGGKLHALSVHAGVWTSVALTTKPAGVPRLRNQLEQLMERFSFDPAGHAGKALVHALTALPHDLVIGFEQDDISRLATTMMGLVDRPRPRLALVEAPLARHLFAFAWLPRDMISTDLRGRVQEMLETHTGSKLLDWSLEVEGGNLAMLRFVLDFRESPGRIEEAEIEDRFLDMLRGWNEAVEKALGENHEAGRAAALATRYADAFPPFYRNSYGAQEAAKDIDRLRQLFSHASKEEDGADRRDARLYHLTGDPAGQLRLKVYQNEGALPLSDAVPALENFGFRVLSEVPAPLDKGALGTVHDFVLSLPEGTDTAPILERARIIEQAIAAVLNAGAEDDPFNRLVVSTGLAAAETELLRAFYRYLRQTGMGFTIYTVVDALARAPEVTKALIALFAARHDPEFDGNRDEGAASARSAIKSGLSRVSAINDDRLLRLYRSVIDSILRTNAFAPAGREALAFKIDSALVPGLPKPVPWREIFVYSRRVEGIHLRAGPVARGGLRWSDRRDDFRTEVLGLMKAQKVKNAVIVPSGAKGGFYPKQLPDPARDRDGWAAEGQASYEVFIRTLLSVTDNIVDGKVVHPESVVIRDGEDPYFVVAADKGTARFSDVANAIAQSRDFWLDDAFASGGSNGYDHKAMGITAKGAWVSVQRHFLEMGTDIQTDPIEVVGCGDMSGDVFGNGMLLSKAIKLVAAFDHRHIFIDPDPDPAVSWKERQRLFDLPRSSWEDYDSALISKGGGVFPRSAKVIKLSKAAQQALGISQSQIEPDALISAILKAPVDLLWFGGIGTYLKASHENNVQVGDPSNDALRVDARDLQVKVIGEGANLGVTQAARIEFALRGGRINTDFIDNSAGVDCSDNEVNIKIALADAKRSGKLSEKRRVALLADMTDEVSEIVLEDNRLQALALSIAEKGSSETLESLLRVTDTLEEMGYLDRRTEGLADNETLQRRAADGAGFVRPELAVLLSSAKLALQDAIEASTLPDDSTLERNLVEYFPAPMRDSYSKQIKRHRLRREIIATDLANRIVNRLGLVHPFELAEEEGVGLGEVATAFVTAERLFHAREIWEEIDASQMPEQSRIMLFDKAAVAMRMQMADLLRVCTPLENPSEVVKDLDAGITILSEGTASLLAAESRALSDRLLAEFSAGGAPDRIAQRIAHLFDLDGAVGLAQLAGRAGMDPRKLTQAFTGLGTKLGLTWAQGTAALMTPSDVWERLLVAGLARDFQQMRLDFLERISRRKGMKENPMQVVDAWIEQNSPAIRQFNSMVTRAQAHNPVAPAVLAQIASQARNLLSR